MLSYLNKILLNLKRVVECQYHDSNKSQIIFNQKFMNFYCTSFCFKVKNKPVKFHVRALYETLQTLQKQQLYFLSWRNLIRPIAFKNWEISSGV